jgi:hypothetical protein
MSAVLIATERRSQLPEKYQQDSDFVDFLENLVANVYQGARLCQDGHCGYDPTTNYQEFISPLNQRQTLLEFAAKDPASLATLTSLVPVLERIITEGDAVLSNETSVDVYKSALGNGQPVSTVGLFYQGRQLFSSSVGTPAFATFLDRYFKAQEHFGDISPRYSREALLLGGRVPLGLIKDTLGPDGENALKAQRDLLGVPGVRLSPAQSQKMKDLARKLLLRIEQDQQRRVNAASRLKTGAVDLDSLRKQERERAALAINAERQLLSGIVILFQMGGPNEQRFAVQLDRVGGAVLDVAAAIVSTSLADDATMGLATFNAYAVGFRAAASVLSLFANQGPRAEQLILDGVHQLQLQIDGLRIEMHRRFDMVDLRLDRLAFDLNVGLNLVRQQIFALEGRIAEIDKRVADVQMQLYDIRNILNAADTLESLKAARRCITFEPGLPSPRISDGQFQDCTANLRLLLERSDMGVQADELQKYFSDSERQIAGLTGIQSAEESKLTLATLVRLSTAFGAKPVDLPVAPEYLNRALHYLYLAAVQQPLSFKDIDDSWKSRVDNRIHDYDALADAIVESGAIAKLLDDYEAAFNAVATEISGELQTQHRLWLKQNVLLEEPNKPLRWQTIPRETSAPYCAPAQSGGMLTKYSPGLDVPTGLVLSHPFFGALETLKIAGLRPPCFVVIREAVQTGGCRLRLEVYSLLSDMVKNPGRDPEYTDWIMPEDRTPQTEPTKLKYAQAFLPTTNSDCGAAIHEVAWVNYFKAVPRDGLARDLSNSRGGREFLSDTTATMAKKISDETSRWRRETLQEASKALNDRLHSQTAFASLVGRMTLIKARLRRTLEFVYNEKYRVRLAPLVAALWDRDFVTQELASSTGLAVFMMGSNAQYENLKRDIDEKYAKALLAYTQGREVISLEDVFKDQRETASKVEFNVWLERSVAAMGSPNDQFLIGRSFSELRTQKDPIARQPLLEYLSYQFWTATGRKRPPLTVIDPTGRMNLNRKHLQVLRDEVGRLLEVDRILPLDIRSMRLTNIAIDNRLRELKAQQSR